MTDVLEAVLRCATDVAPIESLREWRVRDREAAARARTTIDRAILAGLAADRVGYAFASGYEAALHALVPALARDVVASFCASEEGGAHPRAIATTLRREGEAWILHGAKRWATLAPAADVLLVVASEGVADGRNRLRVVRLDAGRAGITIAAQPAAPFVPEIPHGTITLRRVVASDAELLAGDGYEGYLKPFRTIEDLHVYAALLAFLVRVARAQAWPRDFVEEGLALLAALRGLACEDGSAAAVHVALGGVLGLGRSLVDRAGGLWSGTDGDGKQRWERDRALFAVAERARAARLERAWSRGQGGS